jgi:hypothetical protein
LKAHRRFIPIIAAGIALLLLAGAVFNRCVLDVAFSGSMCKVAKTPPAACGNRAEERNCLDQTGCCRLCDGSLGDKPAYAGEAPAPETARLALRIRIGNVPPVLITLDRPWLRTRCGPRIFLATLSIRV